MQLTTRLSAWRERVQDLADRVKADPARWASISIVTLASAGFALWLLNASRQQWFVTDEFDYFNFRGDSLPVWLLRPHNEHTIVFTKAWFALMGQFVGLRHYAPYMIPLVACHIVVVGAIYRLAWISTCSRVIATGVALMSLTMGAAVGTLTWAGQFQYVGSIAAGLIVLSIAIQNSGRRWLAIAVIAACLGTLNGSAFIAFGVVTSIVYGRRKLWTEAIVMAAIPLGWELVNRLIWAPKDPYAATGLTQILLLGPSFAYSILNTAISQTLLESDMTAVVLTGLILGTIALSSLDSKWRRTPLSGRAAIALALAAIMTMASIVVARLSLPVTSWGGGGYAYLFLVALFPLSGVLLAHVARSRASLVGIGGVFLAISIMGAATFHSNMTGLQSWKTNGGQLLQTAAAELNANMPTYADQTPVPDTAPTVTQERLRALAASGQLDAVVISPLDADQVSLNMQWRIVPIGQTDGSCHDLAVGESFVVSGGAPVLLLGLQPGAAIDLRFEGGQAVRRLPVPNGQSSLQTLSRRTVMLMIQVAPVRACWPTAS